MKRVTPGEPTSFVTLFGILRLRATGPIPRILYFLHPQMAKVGRIALKVSDSEHCPLVWLTQTILIGLTY
jgi:hypothetical protein